MGISKEKREFAMEMLAAMVVERVAEQSKRTYKDVFREFRKSNTLKMLFEPSTGLWMNGPAYIAGEWEIEQANGNKRESSNSDKGVI